MEKDVVRLFHDGLKQLGISLSEESRSRLVIYCIELQKWNRKINLVARNTTLEDLVEKHFIDSLTLLPILQASGRTEGPLLDVGSGAGFPGLVLKTACPPLQTVLLEPRQRRANFLRHIVRTLSLREVEVSTNRLEDDTSLAGLQFSVITSRAVADVATFLRMAYPYACERTLVVCMQGTAGSRNWQKGDQVDSLACADVIEQSLPFSGAKRYLLLFRKTAG